MGRGKGEGNVSTRRRAKAPQVSANIGASFWASPPPPPEHRGTIDDASDDEDDENDEVDEDDEPPLVDIGKL